MLRNGLYIIATPIGNLGDITARAREVLAQAPVIACEDTRMARKLFSLLNISPAKKFITCEDHNEDAHAERIIAEINAGSAVALISDAGSPLISDPGYKLVRRCRSQGIYVTALPGACAVITALQLSGQPTDRFMFAGFIPSRDKARQDLFAGLRGIDTTLVFYETAPRILKTLEQAEPFFGGREISVVRELTKMYEETVTGSFAEVHAHFAENEPKGEFVLVIAPPAEESQMSEEDIIPQLKKKLRKTSLKTAVKEICESSGMNRNEVYELALRLKNE